MARRVALSVLAALFITILASSPADATFRAFDSTRQSIQQALRDRTHTCEDITKTYISRILKFDESKDDSKRLHAIITKDFNAALEQARALDDIQASGELKDLHCVPVVAKDVFDAKGLPTTAGSQAMLDVVPTTDATVIAKLRAAGAVILAKANLAEWSDDGLNSRSSVGGQTKNPYQTKRTAFGSSGGTGAAIAAGLGVIGLGADTEGSILGPSSAANLYGLRSTLNTVDRTGIIPAFSLTDVAGPMTRSVNDLAETMAVLTGDKSYISALIADSSLRGSLTLATLTDFVDGTTVTIPGEGQVSIEPTRPVRLAFDEGIGHLRASGLSVTKSRANMQELASVVIEMASLKTFCVQALFATDLNTYFSRHDDRSRIKSIDDLISQGRLQSFQRRFETFKDVSDPNSDSCKQFLAARTRLTSLLDSELRRAGANYFVFPSMDTEPVLLAQLTAVDSFSTASLSAYSGWPAINIPAGFSLNKLPIGMTILGRPNTDTSLVRIAKIFEDTRPTFRYPPFTPPFDSQYSFKFEEQTATIDDVHWAIVSNLTKCKGLVEKYHRRIKQFNPEINALISETEKQAALDRAHELDEYYHEQLSLVGPLHCVTAIVKDVFDVKNLPTTAGSDAMTSNIPDKDATIISRMRDAGAIFVGKANMGEFSLSTSTSNSPVGGETKNPYDVKRTPFGSSGGTAAALAAGLAVVGLGTSHGASLLGPASAGNIYAFHPPPEAVDTTGVLTLSQYTDTPGPMARSLVDIAVMIDVMQGSGIDEHRAAALPSPVGIRLATVKEFDDTFTTTDSRGRPLEVTMDPVVIKALAHAKGVFVNGEIQSSQTVDFSTVFKTIDGMKDVGDACALEQGQSVLNTYLNQVGSGAAASSIANLLSSKGSSLSALAKDYLEQLVANAKTPNPTPSCAQFASMRASLRSQIDGVLSRAGVNAVLYPTYFTPPHLLSDDDRVRDDIFNTAILSAYSGLPALALPGDLLPLGSDKNKVLPIGVTLLGHSGMEASLFQAGAMYEQFTGKFEGPRDFPKLGEPDSTLGIGEMIGLILGSLVFMAFLLFLLTLLYRERSLKKTDVGLTGGGGGGLVGPARH